MVYHSKMVSGPSPRGGRLNNRSSAAKAQKSNSTMAADEADRAAVIDIGSNTIHLLVADRPGGLVRSLLDEHVHAGLGLAVAEGTPLGTARIQAVADIVRAYAAAAQARGAQNITVIGTHAVRAAPDRAALIDAIEREAG